MESLFDLSGCELVGVASVLAIFMSQNLTVDEMSTLGNFFQALGTNLDTIAASKE